jgi:hypothetical protein
MKNKYSLFACLIISIILLTYRISYPKDKSETPFKVTTWDALGYYFYLPSIFIYHDIKKLRWFPEVDKKYSVSGGTVYQAYIYEKSGNYVFKYYGGVAIMEIPFFFIGHWVAKIGGHKLDGFSPPYQYSIAFGAIFYCILALFLLRKVLLFFFSDITTALTLLFVLLASNFIQYVSVDGAMSHSFIFPLYVLILYFTIKWHQKPDRISASVIGLIIGLATISRPTEAIMFIIPLLWNTQTKELAAEKWQMVKQNKEHIYYACIFGFIGVFPQLLYWKITSGSFVYDVGSSWDFLTPHIKVLIGWEKGWFIYTPIAIFFIIGLFFVKKFPFRKSVITFCLINIYIIISWRCWRYGASYSCRALVQSYPVFALAFAAFIDQISLKKWRYLFYLLGFYLIFVNLFQLKQYNEGIIHYDENNRKYYCSIYLNPHPTAIDMSLLDTDEKINNEKKYLKETLTEIDSISKIKIMPYASKLIYETKIGKDIIKNNNLENWIKIESTIKYNFPLWESYINSDLQNGDSIKHNRIRLNNIICPPGKINNYAFYVKIPGFFKRSTFRLYINSFGGFEGELRSLKITFLKKEN